MNNKKLDDVCIKTPSSQLLLLRTSTLPTQIYSNHLGDLHHSSTFLLNFDELTPMYLD